MTEKSLDLSLEYMCEEHLEFFKQILLRWKEQIISNNASNNLHEINNYPDFTDRASFEENFNLELRERERERKLLKKIDQAILRISNLDYGYCEDCGSEIGLRRLEARPTATKCIECKTIAEIKEKLIRED